MNLSQRATLDRLGRELRELRARKEEIKGAQDAVRAILARDAARVSAAKHGDKLKAEIERLRALAAGYETEAELPPTGVEVQIRELEARLAGANARVLSDAEHEQYARDLRRHEKTLARIDTQAAETERQIDLVRVELGWAPPSHVRPARRVSA